MQNLFFKDEVNEKLIKALFLLINHKDINGNHDFDFTNNPPYGDSTIMILQKIHNILEQIDIKSLGIIDEVNDLSQKIWSNPSYSHCEYIWTPLETNNVNIELENPNIICMLQNDEVGGSSLNSVSGLISKKRLIAETDFDLQNVEAAKRIKFTIFGSALTESEFETAIVN